MAEVTWWLAFGAGVLSFVSPCCLPLYPSYISYITGVSVSQLTDRSQSFQIRRATMFHTLFFILGFSVIFYALGFSVSWLGRFFQEYQDTIRMLGGVLIFVMGLFLLGLFRPSFMMRDVRIGALQKRRLGYIGSILVGMGFAAGWTPCVGPILASVLTLSLTDPASGLGYITAYTLGFAIPFFVMAFFLGRTRWILKYSNRLMKAGGALMVLFGILLYFDQMTAIIAWMTKLTGGFTGF
ncbi:cytochrome c-type biogenesis protein [Planifilum fimeticola]|uniref:Cytochrome c-type biogenesis protein n=1 Tax=Planifilum fimeticola TaxID=201975 RepID=A0A2T0LH80_9BACL|nr:cytochrome c biogenesis protein CcdA [Planifilum fimeticola]PRX41647.1 cytochrome c-type biogenesis protein [Planifilum fimeticola]